MSSKTQAFRSVDDTDDVNAPLMPESAGGVGGGGDRAKSRDIQTLPMTTPITMLEEEEEEEEEESGGVNDLHNDLHGTTGSNIPEPGATFESVETQLMEDETDNHHHHHYQQQQPKKQASVSTVAGHGRKDERNGDDMVKEDTVRKGDVVERGAAAGNLLPKDRPAKDRVVKTVVIKDDRDETKTEEDGDDDDVIKTRGPTLRNPRKSLPLLPRIDQYERHPLLQMKSRTGITEFEMLMIERELLKRRKSMEERGGSPVSPPPPPPPPSSSSSSAVSSNSRRRVGGSLRQPTKLVPRSAHYEPHPLLKKTSDGVYELERILHERHQQQQQQQEAAQCACAAAQTISGHVDQRRHNGGSDVIGTGEEDAKELLLGDDDDDDDDSVTLETGVKETTQTKRVRFQRQKSHVIDDDRRSAAAAAVAVVVADESNGRRKPEVEVGGGGGKLSRRNNEMTSSSSVAEVVCATVAVATDEAGGRQQRTEKRTEKIHSNNRMDFVGRSCCLS